MCIYIYIILYIMCIYIYILYIYIYMCPQQPSLKSHRCSTHPHVAL